MSNIENRYDRRSRTTKFLRNLSIKFGVPIWGGMQQERKKIVTIGWDNANIKR